MNNREIKFRVYNKKAKQWVHGPNYEVNLFGEMILLGGFMQKISIEDLNECVPLQYTGLNDKNGKEIYEGDIIQFERWPITQPIKGTVIFYETEYRIHSSTDSMYYNLSNTVEVVGNIFDNPELLN